LLPSGGARDPTGCDPVRSCERAVRLRRCDLFPPGAGLPPSKTRGVASLTRGPTGQRSTLVLPRLHWIRSRRAHRTRFVRSAATEHLAPGAAGDAATCERPDRTVVQRMPTLALQCPRDTGPPVVRRVAHDADEVGEITRPAMFGRQQSHAFPRLSHLPSGGRARPVTCCTQ
jgi:hypothetical protein